MGCEGYNAIARVYDKLNAEIDYGAWADFIEACFDRYLSRRPSLVLDLACGTGSMTLSLADRGYDMIGIDGSAEMLSEAYNRSSGRTDILWLQQDMRSFELYGTVGAVTCCLDSLNYLTKTDDLMRTLLHVHNYLNPDGLFLFDVNSPWKFEHIYGDNDIILEDREGKSVCCWRNGYDRDSGLCTFDLTIFTENADGRYSRSDAVQQERCYSEGRLRRALERCGFEVLGFFGDYDFAPASETDERWYVAARCKKE